MQRRNFVKFLALSPALLGANNLDSSDFHAKSTNLNSTNPNSLATKGIASIIDLDKCDGCENLATPACVSACKTKNAQRFPEPIEKIPEYFPRKVKEDYSKNRDDITRLTPYNFTFIERVKVGDKAVSIPRRLCTAMTPLAKNSAPLA